MSENRTWTLPFPAEPPSFKRWREEVRERERKIAEAEAKKAQPRKAKSA